MYTQHQKYALILLIAAAVGHSLFLRSEPFGNNKPLFTNQDHEVMMLVGTANGDALLAALRSGRIPVDYAVGGDAPISTLVAARKLPEVFAFLLEQENAPLSEHVIPFVFMRDENRVAESIEIARMHLTHKYGEGEVLLDPTDSMALLMIMCMTPYTPAEVDLVFDRLDIHIPAELMNEAVATLERTPNRKEGEEECRQQVLQHVTPLPA